MFDFDTTKLLLIGVVALAVIPPKDLPRVIRQVGQAVGKVRRMASEFQGQVMEALKEAELDDLKKEITSITDSAKAEVTAITDAAKIEIDVDPAAEAQREITKAIEAEPLPATGGSAADVYARATTAPAALETTLPPVNEQALAALAMPDLPAPPAVTHDLIAAQAGLAPSGAPASEALTAVSAVDLREPESAGTAPETGSAADAGIAKIRKARNVKPEAVNGAAPEPAAGDDAAGGGDAVERVPYRKRVAYVPPGRAARAARRES